MLADMMNMFKFLVFHDTRDFASRAHSLAVSCVLQAWARASEALSRFRILEINQRYLAVVSFGCDSNHVLLVFGAGF
jgi:hypothetical protein